MTDGRRPISLGKPGLWGVEYYPGEREVKSFDGMCEFPLDLCGEQLLK